MKRDFRWKSSGIKRSENVRILILQALRWIGLMTKTQELGWRIYVNADRPYASTELSIVFAYPQTHSHIDRWCSPTNTFTNTCSNNNLLFPLSVCEKLGEQITAQRKNVGSKNVNWKFNRWQYFRADIMLRVERRKIRRRIRSNKTVWKRLAFWNSR